MEEIIFECETVTPMFLAGADGIKPELRAPSIKGAMRFWWRAMHGNLPLSELKRKEAEIFGGSGDNEGKSKVIIKSIFPKLDKNDTIKEKPVPHKNFTAKAIKSDKIFNISFSLLNTSIININVFQNLFILFSILGGVGKRSRRGFGSFKITKINNKSFTEEITEEYIKKLLNKINQNWNSPLSNSNFPYIKKIQLGNIFTSYETLLKKISLATHNNKDKSLGYAKGKYRLASPIYVSILKNKDNKYLPIITILNAVDKNLFFKNTTAQKNFIKEIINGTE